MAPAMHERPRSLGPLHAGEPVIAFVAVALQEASPEAVEELLGIGAAASRRISEQHDRRAGAAMAPVVGSDGPEVRSEEHTSELQSLMRISYAVFCLKKK